MAEEKTGILNGFKEFVLRGNVIDLAVAVVVGAAFTAVVKSFNDEIITPVLATVGAGDTGGWGFCVGGADPCTADSATFIDIGAVIGVLITFVITLAVVYFIFVLPMNRAREMARITPKEAETPADVLLLTEIRDLLSEGTSRTPEDRSND